MYVDRTIENFLGKAAAQFPVMLVVGPRQVGKTTTLRHLSAKDRTYITLDDPTLATLAREEPALFLQRFPPPVLIDEIQYAPELLPHIKMHVDRDRAPGAFWLTGSQQFQMMQGVSESLAGRVGIVNLLGLSQFEMSEIGPLHAPFLPTRDNLAERLQSRARAARSGGAVDTGLQSVYRQIWRGAYPAFALNDAMEHELFYGSYVQTYLQRDVRDLANVGDEGVFLKFLRASAARTGQMLNMSDMARDVGISVPTAKRWLSVLEASGIVYFLEPYHNNVTKRLVKAPKLYFLDTGLCAYLTAWSSPETLEAGAMSGAILETFVFAEILKSYWHNGRRAAFYYYRDKDKKEIDLLIVQDETLYPLEIKKTAQPGKDAIRHFKALERLRKPIGEGGVICLVENYLPITKDISAIPIALV